MREILFRGKAINRRADMSYCSNYKDGDWVYGLVTKPFDKRFPKLPAEMRNTDGISRIEVDYRTVGQYTGLTDKNGNKIFEGDILGGLIDYNAKRYINAVVEFSDGSFGVRDNRCGCNRFTAFTGFCNMKWEKIGNIYDNPEMLED